jgi:hypothetical protein
MARLKKYNQPQNLLQFRVLVTDDDPNSRFFRLTQFQDTLTSGKNAFLINGSPELEPTTEVKVELVDSEGNTVFLQPIRNYQEGLARVVSIEIYEDTPPGPATLTLMGELRQLEDGSPVPAEWSKAYNVKWTRKVTIDPARPNTTPIRLYNRPTIQVSELLVPVRNAYAGSTVTSALSDAQLAPVSGGDYGLVSSQLFEFRVEMIGGEVRADYSGVQFTGSIQRLITAGLAQISPIPSASAMFAPSSFKIIYQNSGSFTQTSYTRSYADIKLKQLTTFSGDIQKARVYVKTADSVASYEQLATVSLEATELTVTASNQTANTSLPIGDIYAQSIIDSYWDTGTATLSGYGAPGTAASLYASSSLINSAHINVPALLTTTASVPTYYFRLRAPVSLIKGHEYSLDFDLLSLTGAGIGGKLELYLSGSAFPSTGSLGKKLTEFDSSAGLTRTLLLDNSLNFFADSTGTATVAFVVYSGDWYYSNIHLYSSEETGFNPDEAEFIVPVSGRKNEKLRFRTELYDVNNNLVPIIIESSDVMFDGGNIVIRGSGNQITDTLTVVASASLSGSGITLSGKGFVSASVTSSGPSIYIGAGEYKNPNTPFLVASGSNGPIFSIADKFYGHPSGSSYVVTVSGSIVLEGQQGAGNWINVRDYVGNYTSSLSSSLAIALIQNSIQDQAYADTRVNLSTSVLIAQIAALSASAAQTGSNANILDSVNRIILPASPTHPFDALYIESGSIGFYSVSNTNWPVLINGLGQFRFADPTSYVGGADPYSQMVGFANGAFVVRTKTMLLNTNGMRIQGVDTASAAANVIQLGVNAAGITATSGSGYYVDGAGNFRVGSGGTGMAGSGNYVQLTGSSLFISSSFFDLSAAAGGNTLKISTTELSLGNPNPTRYNPVGIQRGLYANSQGQFFVGSGSVFDPANPGGTADSGNWISFGSIYVNIRADQFRLATPTINLNSFLGIIAVGTNATSSMSQTVGTGVYMDGSGFFRAGNPATQYIKWDGTNLTVVGSINIVSATTAFGTQLSPGNNLLTTAQNWKLDPTPIDQSSVVNFNVNGPLSSNEIIIATGSYGNDVILWHSTGDSGAAANGGWNTDSMTVDPTKTYRYSVWIHRRGTQVGTNYHGVAGNTVKDIGTGLLNNNPYFDAYTVPADGDWYLFVGYVFPYNYGTVQRGMGGTYRKSDGVRVRTATDYKWAEFNTFSSSWRTYLYYSNTTADHSYFYAPRVDIVDGSEPSIDSMLGLGASGYSLAGSANTTATNASSSAATVTTNLATTNLSIFTDSTGKINRTPGSLGTSGLYLNPGFLGFYNGSAWKTYMDSQGHFFLSGTGTHGLTWDGTTLTIAGSISILSGQGRTDIDAAAAAATGAQGTANAATGSAANAQGTANAATGSAATAAAAAAAASTAAAAVQTNLNTTNLTVFTDSTGKVTRPKTGTAAGLYLDSTNLGFWDGSAWKTFMSNTGNFFLSGGGSDSLSWSSGVLTINGVINITGGNASTQTDAQTRATTAQTNAVATAQSDATTKANAARDTAQSFATTADTNFSSSLATSYLVNPIGKIKMAATPSGTGLFLGSSNLGYYNGSAWTTYMDNSGNFYLGGTGGSLQWTNGVLSISGIITVQAGSNAAKTDFGNVTAHYAGSTGIGGNALNTDSVGSSTAAAVSAGTVLANNHLNSSGLSRGIIAANLVAPAFSASGLYMQSNLMGYWDSTYGWNAYIQSNGVFYFGGPGTSQYIYWDGATLTMRGSITVLGGDAATQTYASQSAASAAGIVNVKMATDIYGKIIGTTAGYVFNGAGLYMNSSWLGFVNSSQVVKSYMDSSGNFFLSGAGSDSLSWSGGALTINGTINIAGGNAATQTYAVDRASDAQTAAQNTASGDATTKANAARDTAQSFATSAVSTLSSSVAIANPINPLGFLKNSLGTMTGKPAALYLGSANLGYWNGSSWKSYMDNSGNFYLSGAGAHGLSWDGTTLAISGNITVADGTITAGKLVVGTITAASGVIADRWRARQYRNSSYTVYNVGSWIISMTTDVYNIGGVMSGGRITIPTGGNTGAWQMDAQVTWSSNSTGLRTLSIKKNGTTVITSTICNAVNGANTIQQISITVSAPAVGDYFEMELTNGSGIPLAILGSTTYDTWISTLHIW